MPLGPLNDSPKSLTSPKEIEQIMGLATQD